MRRYREIDILRGFAIVLVILGHAIVVYPVNLMNVAWCKSAFSFVITLHMPIFFGIAGFCFHQNKSYTYMVKKKICKVIDSIYSFQSNGHVLSAGIFRIGKQTKQRKR